MKNNCNITFFTQNDLCNKSYTCIPGGDIKYDLAQ